MPIEVISNLVPKNGSGCVVDDKYVMGGHRVVENVSDLSLVGSGVMKVGMTAYVSSTKETYVLESGNVWSIYDGWKNVLDYDFTSFNNETITNGSSTWTDPYGLVWDLYNTSSLYMGECGIVNGDGLKISYKSGTYSSIIGDTAPSLNLKFSKFVSNDKIQSSSIRVTVVMAPVLSGTSQDQHYGVAVSELGTSNTRMSSSILYGNVSSSDTSVSVRNAISWGSDNFSKKDVILSEQNKIMRLDILNFNKSLAYASSGQDKTTINNSELDPVCGIRTNSELFFDKNSGVSIVCFGSHNNDPQFFSYVRRLKIDVK